MAKRGWKYRSLRRGMIGVGVLLLLVAGLFGYVQTPWGKAQVAGIVSGLVSDATGWDVEIKDVAGTLPFNFSVGAIGLSDAEGRWLYVEDAEAETAVWPLLRGHVQVMRLAAAATTVYRLPASDAAAETEEDGEPFSVPTLPALPTWIEVDELRAAKIVIAEPVAGVHAELQASARYHPRRLGQPWNVGLEVQGTAETETRARIEAGVQGQTLTLDADINDPQLLPGMLEVEGPFVLTLKGEGTVDAWKGQLAAQLADQKLAGLDLSIQGKTPARVQLAGPVDLRALNQWAGPLAPLNSPLALSVDASAETEGVVKFAKLQVVAEEGAFKAGRMAVNLQGRVNPFEPALDVDGTIETASLAPWEAVAGTPLQGAGTIDVALSGDAQGSRADLTINLADGNVAEVNIETAAINATVTGGGLPDRLTENLSVTADGAVSLLAPAMTKPQRFNLDIAAKLPSPPAVNFERLNISDGNATLTAQGTLQPLGLESDFTAELTAEDLWQTSAIFDYDYGGTLQANVSVQSKGAEQLQATWAGTLLVPTGFPEPVPGYLGDELAINGEALVTQERIELTKTSIASSEASFEGYGWYRWEDAGIEATVDGRLGRLVPIGTLIRRDLRGALEASAQVKGTLADFGVEGTAQASGFTFQPFENADAIAEFSLKHSPEQIQGSLKADVKDAKVALSAESGFAVSDTVVRLEKTRLSAGENRVTADGEIDWTSWQAAGTVDASLQELDFFGTLLDMPLAGAADLQAKVTQEADGMAARGTFSLRELVSDYGEVAEASGDWDLRRPMERPEGHVKLSARDVRVSTTRFESVDVNAQGSETAVQFDAAFDGMVEQIFPVKLNTAGEIGVTEQRATLQKLEGTLERFPVTLKQPVTGAITDGVYSLEKLSVGIGDGTLTIAGQYGSDSVSFDGTIEKAPLALAVLAGYAPAEGTVSGTATVRGTPAAPTIGSQFQVAGFRIPGAAVEEVPPLQAQFEAKLRDGNAALSGSASIPDAAQLEAQASAPTTLSFSPWQFELPPNGALNGEITGTGALGAVPALLGLEDHLLQGELQSRFAIGGTISDPRLDGEAVVKQGRYENRYSGTILDALDIRLEANNDRLNLATFKATDGGEGRYDGSGTVQLNPAENFPFDFALDMKTARVIRRDDLSATAAGKITVAGDFQDMKVIGNLTGGPAVIKLPERLPPAELTPVEYTEVNTPGGGAGEAEADVPEAMTIALDITLDMPGKIFVRGAELDSEWKGQLKVKGTASEPLVEGTLNIISGRVEFLGRRLKLGESTIAISPDDPSNPYVNVTAIMEETDLTARLRINGPVNALKLSLDSTPTLPRDEILARILFGRSVDEISPVQALQLARYAAMFSGTMSGPGFLGLSSKLPGIDTISLRPGEEGGGPRVGVGKYVTEDVYVEVEQGAGSEDSRVTVDWNLTPQWSVRGSASGDTKSGVGIFWKRDY